MTYLLKVFRNKKQMLKFHFEMAKAAVAMKRPEFRQQVKHPQNPTADLAFAFDDKESPQGLLILRLEMAWDEIEKATVDELHQKLVNRFLIEARRILAERALSGQRADGGHPIH